MAEFGGFTVEETEIPGLLTVGLSTHDDERGSFIETYQREKLTMAGLPADFVAVQANRSHNIKAGTVRGIHAEPWAKYINTVKEVIFCAFVDLRAGKNFGKKVELELSLARAIFIPEGVGNSYMTLEPDTDYTYMVGAHWSEDAIGRYTFANLADPEIGINWPIPLSRAIMNDKDRNHPMLADVTPMVIGDGGTES
jgi:dTDP-4-dehydrorhamnose 3,5-epimerase